MTSSSIGLSLSGGGYRAAAFHLGTLQKLEEMGILSGISVISTISGGSIVGAAYMVSKDDFKKFKEDTIAKLSSKNLIIRAFFTYPASRFTIFLAVVLIAVIYFVAQHQPLAILLTFLAFLFLLYFFQFWIFPVSKAIEKSYAAFFTKHKTLGELPEQPVLVIGSTNLQTARPFVFSKNFMGDSAYTYAETPIRFLGKDFPLARAVMASSCVPAAFSPVIIDRKYFERPELFETYKPVLADGGVYDNQGIHKIMQSGSFACDIVITSDAGNRLKPGKALRNSLQIAMRAMTVFMTRIKNVQMITDVYQNHSLANKELAYLSLGWDADNCIPGFIRNLKSHDIPDAVIARHGLKEEWIQHPEQYEKEIAGKLSENIKYDGIVKPDEAEVALARKVGTNLTPLKPAEIRALMKQAAALTEIQLGLYCPSL
jgi:NTE family protein